MARSSPPATNNDPHPSQHQAQHQSSSGSSPPSLSPSAAFFNPSHAPDPSDPSSLLISVPANSHHYLNRNPNPNPSLPPDPYSFQPYSDSSPVRTHSRTHNELDQREQDVQAALHFSRARASAVDHNRRYHQHSQSDHPMPSSTTNHHHHFEATHHNLGPSSPRHHFDRRSSATTNNNDSQLDQDVLFFHPSNNPSSSNNNNNNNNNTPINSTPQRLSNASPPHPAPGLDLILPPSESSRITTNNIISPSSFRPLRRTSSEYSFDSSHGAFIDHRPLPPPQSDRHHSGQHLQFTPTSNSTVVPTPVSASSTYHRSGTARPNSGSLAPSNRQIPTSDSQPSNSRVSSRHLPPLNITSHITTSTSEPISLHRLQSSSPPLISTSPPSHPQSTSDPTDLLGTPHHPTIRESPSSGRSSRLHPANDDPSAIPSQGSWNQLTSSTAALLAQADRASVFGSSRRPSDDVEGDVCFPLPLLESARVAGSEQRSSLLPDSSHPGHHAPYPGHAAGLDRGSLAGMLPHFPFPFDFQALEEFAEKERETLNMIHLRSNHRKDSRPSPSLRMKTPNHQAQDEPRLEDLVTKSAGTCSSEANDQPISDVEESGEMGGDEASNAKDGIRRRKIGFLPSLTSDKPDESLGDRRAGMGGPSGGRMGILKQRRLSENIGPINSRQRKLALFEGGIQTVNGLLSNNRSADSGTVKSNNLDSRASFLPGSKSSALPTRSQSGGGPGGPPSRDRTGQVHWAAMERPYRFSFYSNALPSTIHAKSLAEIPADGQRFEDLFVGRVVRPTMQQDQPQEQGGMDINKPTERLIPEMLLSGVEPGPADTLLPELRSYSSSLPTGAGLLSPPLGGTNAPGLSAAQMASHSSAMNQSTALGQQARYQNNTSLSNSGKPRSAVLMRTDEDAEANTWWLDVLCPTDQEMKVLSKVFGIHPLTTEDIQMEETREKIELFRNYYLVCFRSFDQDPYSPTYLEPLNMYIIVFREGTLSFHFRGTPHPQNVRRRIKQLKDYINVTSDWISYALIDDITDAFGPLIQSIEYEVDSIDELVLILKDAEQSDMLRRIGTCRKKVMGLLRLMGNKADVVKGLAKRCNENWSVAPKSDIGLYLSDIQDHLVTMTQNLNHYEKILSRSHSNYLAQISIEMTDANNQINDVLSKLTALGSILVPMNLVTGLWGMNVHVPGQDVTEGYGWFIAIVCGLVTFGIIGAWLTIRYFKISHS